MSIQPTFDATTRTWKRRDTPRAFLLKFDQSKLKSANPVKRLDYQVKQELWGVVFTNGAVCLERDFMNYWRSFTDMCDHFGAIGRYDVTFLDEMESEQAE
jgi:hypothetical protein